MTFNQLCVWQGTTLGDSSVEDFVKFFADMGFHIQYAEQVTTLPDVKDGRVVEGTGGRTDQLFYIADEDVDKFAIPRLQMGIRWWEDVIVYNNESYLYPKAILDKYPSKW